MRSITTIAGAWKALSDLAAAAGAALVGFSQSGAGAVARTLQDKARERVNINDFGALADGATDSTAEMGSALADMGEGSELCVPFVTGSPYTYYYKITDSLALASNNSLLLRGAGRKSGRIYQATAGKNCIDSGLTWATRKNGTELRDLWLSGVAGSNYGVNWEGCSVGELTNLYLEGFTAGIYSKDSLSTVMSKCFLAGGTDGVTFPNSAGTAPNNWRIVDTEFESQSQYGINASATTPASFTVERCSFQSCDKGGMWFAAGYQVNLTDNYFESNFDGTAGTFDIKYGTSASMRGGVISGNYFASTASLNHYPLRLGNLYGTVVDNNVVNQGSHYISFLNSNIYNCRFGSVKLANGTVDKSAGTGATYENIPKLFVHQGNIMEDYTTVPCGDTNVLPGDWPYGPGWFAGAGAAGTTTRSPNTGSVPDSHNGLHVVQINQTGAGSRDVYRAITISDTVNADLRGNWVTFMVDVMVNDAAAKTFDLYISGTVMSVAFNVFSATLADGWKTYAVNFYVPTNETSLTPRARSLEIADYRFANPRLYKGLDARRMAGQAGPTVWKMTAAPTTGTWALGDRVFNSSPSVGQPKSWVCTNPGTPGTWTSEGNL